jgi:DNA-binding MarR family transcriptional regulator
MKLEEELRLVIPIDDPREKAVLNLVYTYTVILERTLRVLKPLGLNDQHYNILKILLEQDPRPVSVGEVKNLLLDKRGDLTRLLDKLSAMAFISRVTNAQNRRMVLVNITAKGKERLLDIDARLEAGRDTRRGLTRKEAEQLNTLLDRLRG